VSQIAISNAFNRANVIVQRPAGDYQPGSSDNSEQRCNAKRGGDTDMKEPVAEIAREIHGHRSRHHDRH
jgi:hypothetical protein